MRTRIESHRTTEKNCFMCIILLLLVLTYDFIGMGARTALYLTHTSHLHIGLPSSEDAQLRVQTIII